MWVSERPAKSDFLASGYPTGMQVLTKDNEPIPGLYARGNNAGCTSGNCDWYTVTTGNSIGNAFTGGYVAALHVCGVIGDEA